MRATLFTLSDAVAATFKRLKKGLSKVCLGNIDENALFTKNVTLLILLSLQY